MNYLIDMLIVIEAAIVAAGAILGRDISLSLACFAGVAGVVAMRLGLYFMDRGDGL